MKTYAWSVHDQTGQMIRSANTIVETNHMEEEPEGIPETLEITNVIENIQKKENLDISHYHEFRLKEV